ncbi:MAG: hypothetical protein HRU20_25195 [Pseudomonadales bacterium]|nr:hypothetical protein [Pseudomonadales bacterium]
MNKLLIATTLSASALITNTAQANEEGEFSIRGVYGEMNTEANDSEDSGKWENGDSQGAGNLELKFETDQYFIRASHTRREENGFSEGPIATPKVSVKGPGDFKTRQTEAEFGYKAFRNDWVTLSATTGLREYKTELSLSPSGFNSEDRWTEVFVGAQVDVDWWGGEPLNRQLPTCH